MLTDDPVVALAVGAHPDDVEFLMAGTLLRLKEAGAQIHMGNLANGSCGTTSLEREEIIRTRRGEAEASAREAGAIYHGPLVDDIAIFYEPRLLAQVAAIVRRIKPGLLLVPSPDDYMEDHQNTCRLLVTAAFVRGMRNFATDPPTDPWHGDVAVYHAMPAGLRDNLRRPVRPEQYVDVTPVLAMKGRMLACHRSQREWLDASQGMDTYLTAEMERMGREVGRMSGRFEYAEGWRRRLHLGFGPEHYDPLAACLGEACWTDPQYWHDIE